MVIDDSTEFGTRAMRHLREEIVVWLTTVTPRGAPLPSPVWFLWDGADRVTVYSMTSARVRNIEANPRVTMNFAGNGRGGDIMILSARARVARDLPAADASPAYLEKYADEIHRIGRTPQTFAASYSVPIEIHLTGQAFGRTQAAADLNRGQTDRVGPIHSALEARVAVAHR
jgi:PPOX class probable F420-dependent enzyme